MRSDSRLRYECATLATGEQQLILRCLYKALDILADDVPRKGDRQSVKQLVEEFRESSER